MALPPFLTPVDEDMVEKMPLDAIVVLGCRVGPHGVPSGAAERRIVCARAAYAEHGEPPLILSGGKQWHGLSEADAFARRLQALGVAESRLLREQRSQSTRQNARFSVALAREHGFERLGVVSCEWHLARAVAAFRSYGVHVVAIPAAAPPEISRARRWSELAQAAMDRALIRLERVGLLALCVLSLLACQRAAPPGAGAAPSASAHVVAATSADPLLSGDANLRGAALRSLSRTSDANAVERLLGGLSDDSPQALEFAAFGLGRLGAGRASQLSAALSLRAAGLLAADPAPAELPAMLGALAGALGRLSTEEGERSLRGWLSFEAPLADAAALALGELGARRGHLDDETSVALLDAAERTPLAVDSALYPFSRIRIGQSSLDQRLRDVAVKLAAQPSPARPLALRALDRHDAVDALSHVFEDDALEPELRAELSRTLPRFGEPGLRALGKRLARFPSDAAARTKLLESAEFPAWLALFQALPSEPPGAREALTQVASLDVPSGAWQARRAILLRCEAARLLAGQNIDHVTLKSCDSKPEGRSGQLALVAVLGRGKLTGARAERFRALAVSDDALVRQAALRLLSTHDELDANELLSKALADKAPGTIAAAAEVLAARPERAGKRGVSDALTRALQQQRDGKNPAVASALIDAAAALQVLSLASDLEALCQSPSATLRDHSERALVALGRKGKRCTPSESTPSRDVGLTRSDKLKLAFETELGELTLTLDPSQAPNAVGRIEQLVRSGFYDGLELHRFVPGFVLQFGDRGGDGYGGSGADTLRSEPGPSRFGVRAVGFAESGADTGSSQIFVTLGRFPHLDGNATYLGEAGPGWERLVQGDRILKARIAN
ncbi:MAG: ElyC/SanA/YdcF family protein [Polyangiaceae bacterium]